MSKNPFKWPKYPTNEAEFESLMKAIDAALDAEGLKPFQRPLNVPRLLWEAFEWGGNVFPSKTLIKEPGYEGEKLIAKAFHWYDQTYGRRLGMDFGNRRVPIRIGSALWAIELATIYGTVQLFADRNLKNVGVNNGVHGRNATYNVLCAVEGLPQKLVDQLDESELRQVLTFYVLAQNTLGWRDALPQNGLLRVARNDYGGSTADVLAGRYGQARWGAQQALEKTMKGLLEIGNIPFATGGSRGHDLPYLAGLLDQYHGIRIEPACLAAAGCTPKIRYGEEISTESQALLANHSVLRAIDCLRSSPNTGALLTLAGTPDR